MGVRLQQTLTHLKSKKRSRACLNYAVTRDVNIVNVVKFSIIYPTSMSVCQNIQHLQNLSGILHRIPRNLK